MGYRIVKISATQRSRRKSTKDSYCSCALCPWFSKVRGVFAQNLNSVSDVTKILDAMDRGDAKAADALLPLVYDELRKLAAARMANEAPGHTLQPTALVHEAWLRLAGTDANVQFANRAHFF